MFQARLAFLATALVFAALPAAAADPATLLGAFQNWSAYSSGSGSAMTCFALSKPRASSPRGAKRGAIYLMISDWPGRKVKAEPQIVLGYPTKADAPASLEVGAAKFDFFARTAGQEGDAWLKSVADNGRLIDTMGKGISAVAAGISSRGTKTSDTYSLAGFAAALAKIHDVCKM